MAYSNTTIPKFPEYDTTANPYAVALFTYGKGEEDWYHIVFAVSASAFRASFVSVDDGEGNVLRSGMAAQNTSTVHRWICGEDGVWEAQVDGDIICMPGLSGTVYQRAWTNHNILDQSGNLWLAANSVSPVGVTENWLRSFQEGLALGLAGKPLPFAQREPVAYLYNGVRLPPLPVVDKEKFPFAVITRGTSLYSRSEVCFVKAISYRTYVNSSGYSQYQVGRFGEYLYAIKPSDSDQWGELKTATTENGLFWCEVGSDYIIWTNTDIHYESGEVAYAASDPVPVYE